MAILKQTMRAQVAEAIAQVNPQDRPIVTMHTVTGPTPWLMGALGVLGMFLVDYYFVTLTEQAVVFHRASRTSNRPKELVFALPRQQVAPLISDARRNSLWSSFRLLIPGHLKPTRFNVHRMWRNELDTFFAALTMPPGAVSGPGAPGVPYGGYAPGAQTPPCAPGVPGGPGFAPSPGQAAPAAPGTPPAANPPGGVPPYPAGPAGGQGNPGAQVMGQLPPPPANPPS